MSASNALQTALAASLLICSTAHAQLFRAYVSGAGNDANPCTLQAPCRLLPRALTVVAPGGEIWMTDSANYNTGTVDINKSVSILAVPGTVGSIVALNGGPAVRITSGSLEVSLRNVVIGPVAGAAAGTHGVQMTGDSQLTIENSLIANLPDDGVRVEGLGDVRIANTTIRNNTRGVYLTNGATADIAGSRLLSNSSSGVRADGTSETTSASVSDSLIVGPSLSGVRVAAGTGGTARIAVTRSTISAVTYAFDCFGSGSGANSIFSGGNLVAYSVAPWFVSAVSCTGVFTAGNNQFTANGAPTGSLTPQPLQ